MILEKGMSEEETPKLPKLPLPLRRGKALQASWKVLLANWLLPGAGYWLAGEKRRAKVFFGVWVVFLALAWLQLTHGAVDGIRGGVFLPKLAPLEWLPTLGALATPQADGTLLLQAAYAPEGELRRAEARGTEDEDLLAAVEMDVKYAGYVKRENLRAVQLLLGHSKLESTVRYLGIEVDDALEISEQTEI